MLVGTHIMNNFKRNAKGKCEPQHLEYLMAVELNLRNLSFRGPYRAFIMGLSVTCWLSSVSFQLFCKLVGWYLSPFPSIYVCKFLSFFFFLPVKTYNLFNPLLCPKTQTEECLWIFLTVFDECIPSYFLIRLSHTVLYFWLVCLFVILNGSWAVKGRVSLL